MLSKRKFSLDYLYQIICLFKEKQAGGGKFCLLSMEGKQSCASYIGGTVSVQLILPKTLYSVAKVNLNFRSLQYVSAEHIC